MEYLNAKQLAKRYNVAIQTIYRWEREDKFPKRIRLADNCTRWRLDEIEAWEAQRGAA